MTVATAFFNWQTSGLDWEAEPWTRCSPNLVLLRSELAARFGPGQYLGCHGDRPVRFGSSPSSHAFGSAFDWRYPPGTADAVIGFLIDNSHELHVQAIHDYLRARIWRPPGTSGRPADSDGWRTSTGAGMGEAWADYLHIETSFTGWADQTPIVNRLVVAPPPPPIEPPPPPPEENDDMLRTILVPTGAGVTTASPWLAVYDSGVHIPATSAHVSMSAEPHIDMPNEVEYRNLCQHFGIDPKLRGQTASPEPG